MKHREQFNKYSKSIFNLLLNTDENLFKKSINLIKKTQKKKGKVYIVGNGGSSSIASHVSVDFAKVARVNSSTFNNANLITCFANDYGYENWVVEAIKAYINKNDMMILISSSVTLSTTASSQLSTNPQIFRTFSMQVFCNRGDTILCSRRAPANKRKLGQSPTKY